MKLLTVLFATLLFGSAALADHAVDNSRQIAAYAYRAADDAEILADHARRDAGWGRREIRPEDHRDSSLLALADAAESSHMALSRLYHSARGAWGPANTPEDHRGDDIRDQFRQVEYYNQMLVREYNELSPYTIDRNVHLLYRRAQASFENLSWLVWGTR